MKKMIILASLIIFVFALNSTAEKTKEMEELYQKYKENYRFFSVPDTVYTIETEYSLPEGYRWANTKKMNKYQRWIAQFPVWNRYIHVGSWTSQKKFDSKKISRSINITWKGRQYREIAFPVRILSEYLLMDKKQKKFEMLPKAGEAITYKKWLEGKPLFNARMELFFEKDYQKENNLVEYFNMINFAINNMNYKSLLQMAEPIAKNDLEPGDFFVATDSGFNNGVMYFVMHKITNDQKDNKYIVATGCRKACDFHIPLFNNDKENPFISIDEIENLGQKYPNFGFYRFKTIK